jgi:hypothetical protein
MLKPIDDFIQSYLDGSAPSCVGSVPMKQNWTPAQRLKATKKHHPVQFEQDSPGAAFAPWAPEILQGTTIHSKNTTVSQSIVIQPTRQFNDPAILQALVLARAETAKRRQQSGR